MATTNNPAAREQWAAYREDALERGETVLLLPKVNRWYPYLTVSTAEEINIRLIRIWQDQEASASKFSAWAELERTAGWRGVLAPEDALETMDVHALLNLSGALEFRRNNLDYFDFLRATEQSAMTNPDVPVAAVANWHYALSYARLLERARTQGAEVGTMVQGFVDPTRFSSLLPSGQAITLLLRYCHRNFARLWDGAEQRRLLAAAHPAVRTFFTSVTDLDAALAGREANKTEAAFYQCCHADIPLVTVQEILDGAGGQKLLAKLPREFRERFENTASTSIGERLQRFVGRLSILDRVSAGTSPAPAAAPTYGVPRKELAADTATKWYEIDPEELSALLTEVEGRPSFLVAGRKRWETYLRHTLNHLTAPILVWREMNGSIVPQFDLAPGAAVDLAARTHEEEQRLIRTELERIDRLLPALRRTNSEIAIRELERKRSLFKTPVARGRWKQHLNRQRQEVLMQRKFREQKMTEFGLAEAGFAPREMDEWLDELLKVEREVRPFMAYVRKAFQAALPVGSTTEFNPFRHRHDGVEFDPETIQDQDKWLRGDVMKTLRTRKNYAPITQVNVFCLDFSRSMNHDLMRNLFKVVFLLVSGLEGRETYDAIHFFGSDFRESVSFTDSRGYTTRGVLAKILSHVATIEQGSVVYSGFGGTNISAAVQNSHARIQAFSKKLKEEKPDLRFVKSVLILTDGQPTVGIINLPVLREFIDGFRDDDVSIKGIYLKHPLEQSDFMARIFGAMHSVEATSFEELIASFVQTMSLTYRQQRKDYRAAQKRKRLLGQRVDDA